MSKQMLKIDHSANEDRTVDRTYSSRSLHGQVVHELGRRIVTGQLAEGEVLPNEADLGREFKVSRTALREGIKVLTAKGLLVSRTRTGTRVRPRSEWNMFDPDIMSWRMENGNNDDFLRELYELRRATEPMAASLAAVRATDQDIAVMSQELEKMEAAGLDMMAVLEPDLRFHLAILQASGNELLASLNGLFQASLSSNLKAFPSERLSSVIPAHRAVFEAIRNRDSVAASEAMYALLDSAMLSSSGAAPSAVQ